MSPWAQLGIRRWQDDADRTLLVEPGGRIWTGRDLGSSAEAWAKALAEAGIESGSLVGLGLPNGPAWIAAFSAMAARGIIVVAREPMAQEHWEEFGKAVGLVAVVSESGITRLRRMRRRPCWIDAGVVLAKVTSGSTGLPRAWPFTASQMEADARQVMAAMRIGRSDHNLGHLPFAHSYALGNLVLPLFLEGVPITLVGSSLPHELAATAESSGATILPTVPVVLRALVESPLVSPGTMASLRAVISAGARLSPELADSFRRRFQTPVLNFYGSTETGGVAFDPAGAETCSGTSVGWPLPGVTVERARNGRLRVTSAAVTTVGRSPESGAVPGSFLLMDRGRIREDGAVVLEGRARGFVKRGGRRLSLAEVELQASSIEGVGQTLAFAIDSSGVELIGLAVESDCSRANILRHMRAAMPRGLRPDLLTVHQQFPLNPRGKVDTVWLRAELVNAAALLNASP